MSYLFGDSTPSSLRINWIDFLRDVFDFAAHVEAAGQQIEAGRERLVAHKQATEVEVGRLEALDGVVARALAGAATGAADSPTAHCAASIGRTVTGMVRSEIQGVAGRLSDEITRLNGEAARAREGCQRALETLLRKHDLPDTESALVLTVADEAPYVARARVTTPIGLTATLDLDVPAAHIYARPVRIERVAEKLEVQAPDASGWLQKASKLRPQRLDRFYLAELWSDAAGTMLKLRASTKGASEGFDVGLASAAGATARLVRIGEDGVAVGDPFELSDGDGAKVGALRDKLVGALQELVTSRKGLASAELDGKPLATHPTPTLLVERIVELIAPTVREIARHSLTPSELVLKRLVSGDRREEMFVTKAELVGKLDKLPDTRRAIFEPLGLTSTTTAAAPTVDGGARSPSPPPPPPPAPPPRSATPPRVAVPVAVPSVERSEPAIPIDDRHIVVALEAEAEDDAPAGSSSPRGEPPAPSPSGGRAPSSDEA